MIQKNKAKKLCAVCLCALLVAGAWSQLVPDCGKEGTTGGTPDNDSPWRVRTEGARGDPILIYSLDDLQNIRDDLTAHYILANDINASATKGWNNGTGFELIGDSNDPFIGVFEGRNYTITELYINHNSTDYVGMFGYVASSGSVKNVGLVDIDITGAWHTGGLVGYNGGTVSKCYATGSVNGGDHTGGFVARNAGVVESSFAIVIVTGDTRVGGIVGSNSDTGIIVGSSATGTATGSERVGGIVGNNIGRVERCYASVNISGTAHSVGGFLGRNQEGTVENCYATGSVIRESGTETTYGGFVGYNNNGKIINCYSTGAVHYNNASDPTDKGFSGRITNWGNYVDSGNFWDRETSGQTTTAGGATGKTTAQMKTKTTFTNAGWNFDNVWWMMSGTTYPLLGENEEEEEPEPPGDPILIYSLDDLQNIRDDLTAHYILANDINASATKGWNNGTGFELIGNSNDPFIGVFEGRNYTITELYINHNSTDHAGMFGHVDPRGSVTNVGLVDMDITGAGHTGGLVGYNGGTVSKCYATGSVNAALHAGGLVARNAGVVEGSFAIVIVTGDTRVGGLIGDNRPTGHIVSSYATGTATGSERVGGILGNNYHGRVEKCYASVSVSGTAHSVGGFLGRNQEGTVENCYATGSVIRESGTETTYGGFVGWNNNGKIINCYSTGAVHYNNASDPTDKGFTGGIANWGNYVDSGNFWDRETSRQTTTAGGATGKTTAQMKTRSTFTNAGWNLDNVWWMMPGITCPLLGQPVSSSCVAHAGPNQKVQEGAEVTFDGSSSMNHVGNIHYIWCINDGVDDFFLTGVSPSHLFTVPGEYTITLIVVDSSKQIDTDTMNVSVQALESEEEEFLTSLTWLFISLLVISPAIFFSAAYISKSTPLKRTDKLAKGGEVRWQTKAMLSEINNEMFRPPREGHF